VGANTYDQEISSLWKMLEREQSISVISEMRYEFLQIILCLDLGERISLVTADQSFNYDIGERVQDDLSSYLAKVVVGGNIPFFHIQSNSALLSQFNSSSGWKSGRFLFYSLMRSLRKEIIIASICTDRISTLFYFF